MPEPNPSPLAEVIEMMSEAARSFLDGPVAHLQGMVDRASRPGYTCDTAAADTAGYSLALAQASWTTWNKAVDAIALLAEPPGAGYRYTVPIPAVTVASTVRIVDRQWIVPAVPEPEGVEMILLPPVVLPPGTDTVGIHVRPLFLGGGDPSWEVRLEIVPVGAAVGTTLTRWLHPLNGTIVE